jgi:hypothetical protein
MESNVTLTKDHIYLDADGHVIPGTTTVIKAAGLTNYHDMGTEYYMERGTAIHKATHLDDAGILDESTIDQAVRPYLEGYRRFKKELHFEPRWAEIPLMNELLRYAGTIDRLGTFALVNNELALIDIKSGVPQPGDKIQAAAYYEICRSLGFNLAGAFIVYVKDGGYKVIQVKIRRYFGLFIHALNLYKFRKEEGLL